MERQALGILAAGRILVDRNCFLYRADPGIESLPPISHVERGALDTIIARLEDSSEGEPARMDRRVGGGCAILSLAAASLGLKALCLAAVGRDEEAAYLEAELDRRGVDARISAVDRPTGVFLSIWLENGQRRIVAAPGASAHLSGAGSSLDALGPGWAFNVDGLLVGESSWIESAAREARNRGALVSLDLSTPFAVRSRARELGRFARECCDIVFANEEEDRAYDESGEARPPDSVWVSKLGSRGASSRRGSTLILASVPAEAGLDGDCTGGGDAFAAGYLAAALQGMPESERLAAGNRSAAAHIARNTEDGSRRRS